MPLKITRRQDRPIKIKVGQTTITVVPVRGKGQRDRITVTATEPILIEHEPNQAAPPGPLNRATAR